MANYWYAFHTISGQEKKVKELLIHRAINAGLWQIDLYEILIPTEQEFSTRNGKKVIINKKVFPGYVLVQMNLNDDILKLIKDTDGVTGVIRSGSRPVPLEPHEIQRILQNIESNKEAPKVAFKKGDIIRVTKGPFSDSTGKVEEIILEREKIRVMINIFGRDTPVELDFNQAEKI